MQKIGSDEVRFTFNDVTNRNGELLVDFMEEYSLFATNTSFMKSTNQLWTFEYPSGKRAQLDYILIRKKWRNSVKNSRSYSTFSTVGSDHRIVSCHLKLSLRSSKRSKPHPMKTIDWKNVTNDKELTTKYNVAVYNKFHELSDNKPLELENINEIYTNLSQAAEDIALELLPKKKKANIHQPCSTIKVTEARERLKRNLTSVPSASLHKHEKLLLFQLRKPSMMPILMLRLITSMGKFQISRNSTLPIDTILPGKQLRKFREKILNQTSEIKGDHQNNVFQIG